MPKCAKFTYHENQDGVHRHIEFWKISVSPDWMEIFAPNLVEKMHHGHLETIT